MNAIYKRELRSYLTSMVGYVFIAIMLLFIGIYFMANNIYNGYRSFGYSLMSTTFIFIVAVPILTMRSMAEDKRNKTDQMLLTAPVSLTSIVLGKYFALVTMLAIPMGLCCFCPIIIALNGDTPFLVDYASIFAFFLLGCAFIAIGMFISALTESQIIAAAATFGALLLLYLWPSLASFLPDSISETVAKLDISSIVNNFAYYSVFDIAGIVLLLSLAALFLYLTILSVKRRKGATGWASMVVAIAVTVAVNLVVGQLPGSVTEIDMSDNSLYTLSDTSEEYLSGLDTNVEIIVLADKNNVDGRVTKFLGNYDAESDMISLSYIDPVSHPSALADYSAEENSIVVRNSETGKQRIVSIDDILVFDYWSYYYSGTSSYTEFDADGQITSAVDYVVSENSHMIYTAENHGEAELGTNAADAIGKSNIGTDSVSLLLNGGVPEDCSLLIFNQPSSDISGDELKMIEDYLSDGGQVVIILTNSSLENFNSLLSEYGMTMAEGYIGDQGNYYSQFGTPYYFCATLDSSSELADGIESDALTLIVGAHGMTLTDPSRDTITVKSFMSTTEYGYSDATEETGTYVLGALATEDTGSGKTSRLTVFTTESVGDDTIISSYPSMANLTLLKNAITSGFDDISGISIPAKSLAETYNTFTNPGLWSMVFIVVLPLAAIATGFIVWMSRRKR